VDEPAILAWETGNELPNPPTAWSARISAYIKSLDSNHLVLDGTYGINQQVSVAARPVLWWASVTNANRELSLQLPGQHRTVADYAIATSVSHSMVPPSSALALTRTPIHGFTSTRDGTWQGAGACALAACRQDARVAPLQLQLTGGL